MTKEERFVILQKVIKGTTCSASTNTSPSSSTNTTSVNKNPSSLSSSPSLLSLRSPTDPRWHYLRSEEDRKVLCGDTQVFYKKRGGGARFGNSFLSRESGMGRFSNIYRNNHLLRLQAEPKLRHLLGAMYSRILVEAAMAEITTRARIELYVVGQRSLEIICGPDKYVMYSVGTELVDRVSVSGEGGGL